MIKARKIFFNAVPILVMIGLIPVIKNDYNLVLLYILIIAISLYAKREKNDGVVFIFGFFAMTFFEHLFVSTGVETFQRNTLFGLMPLWLPLIWAYGFVAIKRVIHILEGR